MKLLAAFLVFMIAAQPVQAGFCGLDLQGSSSPEPAQQHHPDPSTEGHACCDPADDTEAPRCADRQHCGSCATGVAAIPVAPAPAAPPEWASPAPLTGDRIAPAHTSPPFRPPITIS
jgi:hypothetical protein